MSHKRTQAAIAVVALVMISVACRPAIGPSNSPANSPSPSAQQIAVVEDLRKLAATQCGISEQAIDPDAPIQKQGCDELDLLELIMMIEEKYNITISDADTDGATVNSLARIVNRR